MKIPKIIAILFLAMCLPFVADSTEDRTIRRNKPTGSSERRTALVIGNSNYTSSPLKNPANDARDMAKTLEELGFTVIHKENAGLREMEKAVSDFEKQLRQGGAGLFYYAGHGIQVKGSNYLIPTDAEIETESDVRYKAMDAGQVLGKMEDAGNGLNIVILDACRNNPFGRSFRSAQQGLAQMDAPAGSVVIFATGPNSVAADGSGRNGVFTKHLLTHIKTPGMKIEEVVKNVRRGVAQDTGNKQIPWEHSSLMGDFYFADSGSIATEKPQISAEPAKPKQATLNITADVSGAEVWVNGNKQGVLPRNFTISESGKYEVEVTAPGYKKYRTSKNIELGKEYEVAVHLEKEQAEAPPAPVVKPSVSQKPQPPVSGAKYRLRSEPIKTDNESDFKSENVKNEFEDNGDGTITDHATGLIWQKSGSPNYMNYENAKAYIEELNSKKFAGYIDWRLPTVDELKSLLTSERQSKVLYINPIFDSKQIWCWTSDTRASGGAWGVYFSHGSVDWDYGSTLCVRAVRSLQ
jgi:uncharacterized caspase-like protein